MIQEICLDGNLTAAYRKLRHSQGVKFQLTRSRSQKPDIGACEKQEGVETTSQLVIARRKATKLFESVEESRDEVSHLVAMPVGLALGRAVAPRRDDGLSARGFNGFDQGVTVVSLVGHDSSGRNRRHQCGTLRYVGRLTARQDQTQRVTQGVDTGMDLSGQPASRAADRLIATVFLSAPAEC